MPLDGSISGTGVAQETVVDPRISNIKPKTNCTDIPKNLRIQVPQNFLVLCNHGVRGRAGAIVGLIELIFQVPKWISPHIFWSISGLLAH
jgi:hypothetical protein